jgi:uncharacterized protein YegL
MEMKTIEYLAVIIGTLIFQGSISIAQTIDIFNANYSGFPNNKAEFYAFDRNNQQIYNFPDGNLVLTENGIERQIVSVTCPQTEPLKISSVLTLDVSGSMLGYRMQMAKNAARAWVEAMDLNNSECAITTFNERNYFNIDFTQDEDELMEAIGLIGAYGGTSFNAGLIDSVAGSLLVAQRGKFKRTVVFLTDGISNGNESKIIQMANSTQTSIYCVVIGMGAPDILKRISNATGGLWFDNVNTEEDARKVFLKILKNAQNSGPCTIEWESDLDCERNRDITLTMLSPFAEDDDYYLAPANSVPLIESDPYTVSFGKVIPTKALDTTITIKAVNSDISIQNITVSDPHFSIVDHGGAPPPYVLDKDDSRDISVRFTPTDSAMIYARLVITSDACIGNNIYISGGFPGIGRTNSLKIIVPNGGESFGIGVDTVIKWEGVLPADTVLIDYSTDGGASWINITENATGLSHDWKVPPYPSPRCLAKIQQKKLPDISEFPANPIPLDGLIAYYPFCNGAEDKSGNQNHGITTGTDPIADRFDQYNSAMYFDGIDDQVLIKNKGSFNISEWTFSAWVNIHSLPKTFSAIIQKDENSQRHYNYALLIDKDRRFRAQYETCNDEADHKIQSKQQNIYEWVHVANVRDNSTGVFILYINGAVESSIRAADQPCINPNDLRLGVNTYLDNPENPEYFNGVIDDVFIYDRPLDSLEIVELYEAGPIECQPFRMADTSDAFWEIVAPVPISKDIDMGDVLIGSLKDSVVVSYIENDDDFPMVIENISFAGTNPSDFEVISPNFPINIDPNETADVEFRFEPKAIGKRDANIFINTAFSSFNYNITGNGVLPEIEIDSDIIDFGKVLVGDNKDTLVKAVIKNQGVGTINISSVQQLLPDIVQFDVLDGGDGFTLSPNASHEMLLRFAPEKAGRTSGGIGFYYDGVGSPAVVELYGEGIRNYPEIIAPPLDFGNIVCENMKLDSVPISNAGGEELIVNDAKIEGSSKDDFSFLEPFTEIRILPDSTKFLKILYAPFDIGDSQAELILESNAFPDSVLALPLTGRKDTLQLSVSDPIVDFGVLCPNERSTKTITIKNEGTLRTGAFFDVSDMISVTPSAFSLNPQQEMEIQLLFIGTDQVGDYNGKITSTDSICGRAYEVDFRAEVLAPVLQVEPIEILSQLGSNNIGLVTINNLSARDAEIISVNISDQRFEVLPNQLPLSIAGLSSADLQVRYTPTDTASVTAIIEFIAQPCDVEYSSEIIGRTVASRALIRVGNISAAAGENVILPIYLEESENLEASGATGFKIDIEYNGTLIYPVDITPIGMIENGNRIIELQTGITPDENEVIAEFPFIAMLGNAEETAISVLSSESVGGSVLLETLPGSFSLLDVCKSGGVRLFDSEGNISLSQNEPNPAKGITKIQFEIIEDSHVDLSIYNILGEKIFTAIDDWLSTGSYETEFDVSKLGSGSYFYVLKSKTFILSKRMEVIK